MSPKKMIEINFVTPGSRGFSVFAPTNKSSTSSSPSRHTFIHEFGDLDMPLAMAQLGQWPCPGASPGAPVELKFSSGTYIELHCSSGTPVNPLHVAQWVHYCNEKS